MAQTIAALFDSPVPAQRALQALMTAGLSGRRTALIGSESRGTEVGSFQVSSGAAGSELAAIPAGDRALFEEGLRQGGSVLLADIAGDVEEAIRIIEPSSRPISTLAPRPPWHRPRRAGERGPASTSGHPSEPA